MAYSSLNVKNRGRPCRLNSLLRTLSHLISQEQLKGNINQKNNNNDNNDSKNNNNNNNNNSNNIIIRLK